MTERERRPSSTPRASTKDAARPSLDPEGAYRIATVAELTEVPEPTLRAWSGATGSLRRAARPPGTACTARPRWSRSARCAGSPRRGMAAAEAAKRALPRAERTVGDDERATSALEHDAYGTAVTEILGAIERFDDEGLDEQLRRLLFLGGAHAHPAAGDPARPRGGRGALAPRRAHRRGGAFRVVQAQHAPPRFAPPRAGRGRRRARRLGVLRRRRTRDRPSQSPSSSPNGASGPPSSACGPHPRGFEGRFRCWRLGSWRSPSR